MTILVTPFQVEIAREAVEACEEAVANGEPGAQDDLDRARALLARYTGEEAITDFNEAPKVAAEHNPNRPRPAGGKLHRNQHGVCRVRTVSPRQARFIQFLIDTHVVPAQGGEQLALEAFRKGTLNLRHAGDLIDWLKELPAKQGQPKERMASEKQVACIQREGERRQHDDSHTHATVAKALAGKDVTFAEARHALDVLFNAPFTPRPKSAVLEPGMYLKQGQVYKVQFNQGHTHTYAKVLVLPENGAEKGSFEYAGGTGKLGLTAEHKMTLEEAKAFGVEFGVCCRCAATLTNPDSIEAGIGPICASKGF